MWDACHGPEGVRIAWPDGRPTLDQPAIVVRAFGIVGDVVVSVAKAKAKTEAMQ